MENPDLVLQETGSRPTYSRLNYVPSGDTLRRDAISSLVFLEHKNTIKWIIFLATQVGMCGTSIQAAVVTIIIS